MSKLERDMYFAVLMSNVNAGRHAWESGRAAQEAVTEFHRFNRGPIARLIAAIRGRWRMRHYPKIPA
jgi:hypothetical protein